MTNYRKPHRIKKKKSIFKNWFFWLTILIIIIIGGIFYLLFFYSFFQVKDIEIFGNKKLTTEDLRFLASKEIEKNILNFPTKTIFLVNTSQIEKKISENFPLIENASLKREFPDKIILEVKERKPVAIFYPQLTSQDSKAFFIDKYGIVFELTEDDVAGIDLPKLKKEINRNLNIGDNVMREEEISKILETNSKLKNELEILPQETLIVSEEGFNVLTSENFQIYFNFQEDINWQLTKLKAVLDEEIPIERRSDLEYIDVRFDNFSPYKYRQSD